ncbi:MAG: hypothetical protein MR729_06425 [Dorea sp.]|uniref:hypothetical protein n=1 Tax=Dorea sp. YH-dor226 TaxID=3151119 RepID=UPI00306F2C96|nr:hypothetical protein [Dorea sp.]
MDRTMDILFGLLGVGCGAYCIYSSIHMTKTQTIDEKILLGKDTKASKCKDKAAFLKEVIPYVVILGIVALIYGVIQLVDVVIGLPATYIVIGLVAFVVATVLYAIFIPRAARKYF